jgi:hypothetical protein
VAVRVAAACAAAAAFYVAWFVYEDEERQLQNKIETWWLEFDDIRSRMVSRQAAFVVVVAQRASGILDRMFGPALLARDSIAEAVCLTVAGFYFWPSMVSAILPRHGEIGWASVAVGVPIFACAAAPLASPRLRLLPRAITWMFVAFLLASVVLHILLVGQHLLYGTPLRNSSFQDVAPQNLVLVPAFVASIALTLFHVAVARRAMRLTIEAQSEWPIVLGMAIVSVPIGIVCALFMTILFRSIAAGNTADSIYVVTPSNVLMIWAYATAVIGLASTTLWALLAIIAGIMLLHRLVWPLGSRLLYALGRYRLVQNKVALNAAGAALAGIAVTGSYSWQSLLKLLGIG